jgi:hypothetical protein
MARPSLEVADILRRGDAPVVVVASAARLVR